MLVSNGFTVRDAHANVISLLIWVVAFVVIQEAISNSMNAAVSATAIASLAGQASRYWMIRKVGLVPIMGHRLGPALPIVLTGGVLVWCVGVL